MTNSSTSAINYGDYMPISDLCKQTGLSRKAVTDLVRGYEVPYISLMNTRRYSLAGLEKVLRREQ